MRLNLKRELFSLTMLAIVIVVTLYFYLELPDRLASHYNFKGEPDRYSDKGPFVTVYLTIMVGVYLLMTFIPLIDPFWKKIQGKYNIFLLVRDCVMFFSVFFYFLILFSAKTGKLHEAAFGSGIGLLFILLGNYLPKIPRNFFFGIRSPWTLASEEVWKRSHIMGGWLFVLGGILMMIVSIAGIRMDIAFLAILVPLILFTALIYPLWLYKKLEKEGKLGEKKI